VAASHQPICTADEALNRLREGNARFATGRAQFPTMQADVLAALSKAQQPYATILGCSDSRVPPELLFDAGIGDLFVIRVAGNVLGPLITGTLQYAGTHLHTPLFVVLGHEGCGAVQAAIAEKFHGTHYRSGIASLLKSIGPALNDLDQTLSPAELLSAAVEANVRWTIRGINESPERKVRTVRDDVKLVGAIYDLVTGRVRFLE
jgi:carbonic anhydrase